MIENRKVISRSLIVLFLTLSVVYSLAYQKKESIFKSTIKARDEIVTQTKIQQSNSGLYSQDLSNNTKELDSVKMSSGVSLGNSPQPSGANNLNTKTFDTVEQTNSVNLNMDIKLLSGTTEYFGTLDIVSILGEKPKFTLQDSKGNYFVYYGNHLDFIQTIKALGGNVYEMVTESEILQNQLFGDRVSYINLSSFKDIRVIMVIEVDEDVWLLQIPADKYHQSKDYIKSLFIH